MEPPPPTWAFATSDARSKSAVDASTMATLDMNTPLRDPAAKDATPGLQVSQDQLPRAGVLR